MGKRLFVGNLPYSATADDLRALFAELGEVNLKGFAKPVKVFEARRIPLGEGRLDL